eukprot:895345-Pleurochrysis_carterae.AAC.1
MSSTYAYATNVAAAPEHIINNMPYRLLSQATRMMSQRASVEDITYRQTHSLLGVVTARNYASKEYPPHTEIFQTRKTMKIICLRCDRTQAKRAARASSHVILTYIQITPRLESRPSRDRRSGST